MEETNHLVDRYTSLGRSPLDEVANGFLSQVHDGSELIGAQSHQFGDCLLRLFILKLFSTSCYGQLRVVLGPEASSRFLVAGTGDHCTVIEGKDDPRFLTGVKIIDDGIFTLEFGAAEV